jgi:hypothetical protein
MDDSSYMLNFDLYKINANFVLINLYYARENAPTFGPMITKFANFAGLYFPHFTTFPNQTLQCYY